MMKVKEMPPDPDSANWAESLKVWANVRTFLVQAVLRSFEP